MPLTFRQRQFALLDLQNSCARHSRFCGQNKNFVKLSAALAAEFHPTPTRRSTKALLATKTNNFKIRALIEGLALKQVYPTLKRKIFLMCILKV